MKIKEVLFVDAAGRAQSSRALYGQASDILPPLKKGFLAVLTSRTDPTWRNSLPRILGQCQWDEDETRDVAGAYLRKRFEMPGPWQLSDEMIRKITTAPSPPVMYTLAKTADQLESPDAPDKDKRELLENPAPWLQAAEELVTRDAERRIREAAAASRPINQREFWHGLGYLTNAYDSLNLETLQNLLGSELAGQIEEVLDFAGMFFKSRPLLRNPRLPFEFEQKDSQRHFIEKQLSRAEIIEIRRKLAEGCLKCWRRDAYARRFIVQHLIVSNLWSEAATILMDWRYLEARVMDGQISDLAAEARQTGEGLAKNSGDKRAVQLIAKSLLKIKPSLKRPGDLFQSMWNFFRGSDEPRAKPAPPQSNNGGVSHLSLTQMPRLSTWVQQWGNEKKAADPNFTWNKEARRPRSDLQSPLEMVIFGHTAAVTSVAITADGNWIASGAMDFTVRIWNRRTGKQEGPSLQAHGSRITGVAITADGQRIVSSSWDGTVRVWNRLTGQTEGPILEGNDGTVSSVAITPDGNWIVSASLHNAIHVWNRLLGTQREPTLCAPQRHNHTNYLHSVAISADGNWIVSGHQDNVVRVWDRRSGEVRSLTIGEQRDHSEWVRCVAISADGAWIVSGSTLKTVRVWNRSTGKEERVLTGRDDVIDSVAITADGKSIIVGSNKSVDVWDRLSGKLEGPMLEGHTTRVSSVAITPDGNWIVSGSDDNTIRVWRHKAN